MNRSGNLKVKDAMKRLLKLLLISTALGGVSALLAADFTVQVIDKAPPSELGEGIRQLLEPKAVQLREDGQLIYELWFCRTIPIKSKPASAVEALQTVRETTLLGAAAVSGRNRDYKDNAVAPGVYTMRFVLQPQDGDHLGTADYPYFAILIPAKYDEKPDTFTTYRPMVKASGRDVPTGHPNVLSLRPVASPAGPVPRLNVPDTDHHSVVLRLPATVEPASEQAELVFEFVFRGKGHT